MDRPRCLACYALVGLNRNPCIFLYTRSNSQTPTIKTMVTTALCFCFRSLSIYCDFYANIFCSSPQFVRTFLSSVHLEVWLRYYTNQSCSGCSVSHNSRWIHFLSPLTKLLKNICSTERYQSSRVETYAIETNLLCYKLFPYSLPIMSNICLKLVLEKHKFFIWYDSNFNCEQNLLNFFLSIS